MVDSKIVSCPECHVVIGRIIVIQGIELLVVGEMVLDSAHGKCGRCGRGFYWNVSSKALERVVREFYIADRKALQERMSNAHTLEDCREVEKLVTAWLEKYPGDAVILSEMESIIMLEEALTILESGVE